MIKGPSKQAKLKRCSEGVKKLLSCLLTLNVSKRTMPELERKGAQCVTNIGCNTTRVIRLSVDIASYHHQDSDSDSDSDHKSNKIYVLHPQKVLDIGMAAHSIPFCLPRTPDDDARFGHARKLSFKFSDQLLRRPTSERPFILAGRRLKQI